MAEAERGDGSYVRRRSRQIRNTLSREGKTHLLFFKDVLTSSTQYQVFKVWRCCMYLTLKSRVDNAYHDNNAPTGLLETLWTGLPPRLQRIKFEVAE